MSNKTCGECKHYGTPKNCICIFAEETYPAVEKGCKDFEPKPKPTNGDVIRQGGDEALAEFKQKLSCEVCGFKNTGCYAPAGRPSDCKSGILAWLNAPACVKQNGNHDTQTDLCKVNNTESEGGDE